MKGFILFALFLNVIGATLNLLVFAFLPTHPPVNLIAALVNAAMAYLMSRALKAENERS